MTRSVCSTGPEKASNAAKITVAQLGIEKFAETTS
jgi:hypothetical protein